MCYIGRIVSEKGYRISPEIIKAMEELETHGPQNVGDVRKLLGLLGYYCHYVENFSRITKSIYDLLKASAVSTQSNMSHLKPTKRKQSNKFQVPSKTPVVWEEKQKQALNVLIDCLTGALQLWHTQTFHKFHFTC